MSSPSHYNSDVLFAGKPPAGILFDKDGTLINFNSSWLPAYIQATALIARRFNDPTLASKLLTVGGYSSKHNTWQPNSLLASGSNNQILDCWSQAAQRIIDNSLRTEIAEIFNQANHKVVPVIDHIQSTMEILKTKVNAIGLATMDDTIAAQQCLIALKIDHYFDLVIGADSGLALKPDAAMFAHFCATCQLEATQVWVIGDSPVDLKMGRSGGAGAVIGVLSGSHNSHELSPLADVVIDDISDLTSLF